MITTQALIEKFRQALEENWGYIWGTAGVQWTAAKQKELEQTTDPDREQGRRYGKKWIGHRVADCSGLFSWAFRQLGGTMYHGSNTMYLKWCVDKGKLEKGKRTDGKALKPGTAVFVWNGKTYSHVGLYIGDGTVIEAMGTCSGVTTTKVTASKWKYWGELNGVDYEQGSFPQGNAHAPQPETGSRTARVSAQAPFGLNVLEKDTSKQTIRNGSKGEDVKACQEILMKLGYDLGPCGADGDFGKCTDAAVRKFQEERGLVVDGIVGKMTWKELMK